MTHSTPSDDLLARYLAGEASQTERAAVDAWAAAKAAHRAELDQLRGAWKPTASAASWNVDRAWSKVERQMDGGATVVPLRPRATWRSNALLRVAAVLIVAVGIGAIWRPWRTTPPLLAETHTTALGEQRDVDLPDGTRVTLGPATELRVAAGYGDKERRVDLIGEAWFDVHHDAAKPFEVHAFTTITRDVGTTFTIRALRGDSTVRVVMIEGLASLRHADLPIADGVTLRAQDVGIMNGSARVARVVTDAPVQALVAWKTGTLEFDNAPLRDVAIELARWYGLAIRFSDATVATRVFSGPVPTNDLAATQKVLTTALQGLRIVRVADTLIIR